MKITSGRIVNFVMRDGTVRPFLITRVWSDISVNGTLFVDGSNDSFNIPYANHDGSPLTIWKTSVMYSETHESNTWHWPERV